MILHMLDANFNILEDTIYWNLSDIEERLNTKLSCLALIKGYPYKINNEIYYKYTNLYIYKLKNFNNFIKLLETGKIYITFNVDYFKSGRRIGEIHDRGTAFKIEMNNIKDLFELVDCL